VVVVVMVMVVVVVKQFKRLLHERRKYKREKNNVSQFMISLLYAQVVSMVIPLSLPVLEG